MTLFNSKKVKTNWKYLLIAITLAFIGGGILVWQYKWLPEQEIKLPEAKQEIKPEIKEEFIEVALEELKEGENRIGEVIIEKIIPKVFCDIGIVGGFLEWPDEKGEWWELDNEPDYFTFTCNIKNKAKVKMTGWNGRGAIEFFSIIDKNDNLIDQHERDEIFEFREDTAKVEIFDYNKKTYLLVHGGTYGMKTGVSHYFLYVIDEKENIKFITKWSDNLIECEFLQIVCGLDYGIGYKDNLYLKVGKEIWELDENDTIKNKYPANKIKIQNDKIYFE